MLKAAKKKVGGGGSSSKKLQQQQHSGVFFSDQQPEQRQASALSEYNGQVPSLPPSLSPSNHSMPPPPAVPPPAGGENYNPKPSSHIDPSTITSDGDTWVEHYAVVEVEEITGGASRKKKKKNKEVERKFVIRSFFQSQNTSQREWDEPPSGAAEVRYGTDEMRKMAEMQLEELDHSILSTRRKKSRDAAAAAAALDSARGGDGGGEETVGKKKKSFMGKPKLLKKLSSRTSSGATAGGGMTPTAAAASSTTPAATAVDPASPTGDTDDEFDGVPPKARAARQQRREKEEKKRVKQRAKLQKREEDRQMQLAIAMSLESGWATDGTLGGPAAASSSVAGNGGEGGILAAEMAAAKARGADALEDQLVKQMEDDVTGGGGGNNSHGSYHPSSHHPRETKSAATSAEQFGDANVPKVSFAAATTTTTVKGDATSMSSTTDQNRAEEEMELARALSMSEKEATWRHELDQEREEELMRLALERSQLECGPPCSPRDEPATAPLEDSPLRVGPEDVMVVGVAASSVVAPGGSAGKGGEQSGGDENPLGGHGTGRGARMMADAVVEQNPFGGPQKSQPQQQPMCSSDSPSNPFDASPRVAEEEEDDRKMPALPTMPPNGRTTSGVGTIAHPAPPHQHQPHSPFRNAAGQNTKATDHQQHPYGRKSPSRAEQGQAPPATNLAAMYVSAASASAAEDYAVNGTGRPAQPSAALLTIPRSFSDDKKDARNVTSANGGGAGIQSRGDDMDLLEMMGTDTAAGAIQQARPAPPVDGSPPESEEEKKRRILSEMDDLLDGGVGSGGTSSPKVSQGQQHQQTQQILPQESHPQDTLWMDPVDCVPLPEFDRSTIGIRTDADVVTKEYARDFAEAAEKSPYLRRGDAFMVRSSPKFGPKHLDAPSLDHDTSSLEIPQNSGGGGSNKPLFGGGQWMGKKMAPLRRSTSASSKDPIAGGDVSTQHRQQHDESNSQAVQPPGVSLNSPRELV